MSLGVTCGCCVPDECQGQASPSLNKSGRVPAFAPTPDVAPIPGPIDPATGQCIVLANTPAMSQNLITQITAWLELIGFETKEFYLSTNTQATLVCSATATSASPCYVDVVREVIVNGELVTLNFLRNAN